MLCEYLHIYILYDTCYSAFPHCKTNKLTNFPVLYMYVHYITIISILDNYFMCLF